MTTTHQTHSINPVRTTTSLVDPISNNKRQALGLVCTYICLSIWLRRVCRKEHVRFHRFRSLYARTKIKHSIKQAIFNVFFSLLIFQQTKKKSLSKYFTVNRKLHPRRKIISRAAHTVHVIKHRHFIK